MRNPTGARCDPTRMIERLIAFDTTSSKSNLALIDFVEAYLRGHARWAATGA